MAKGFSRPHQKCLLSSPTTLNCRGGGRGEGRGERGEGRGERGEGRGERGEGRGERGEGRGERGEGRGERGEGRGERGEGRGEGNLLSPLQESILKSHCFGVFMGDLSMELCSMLLTLGTAYPKARSEF